MLAGCFWLGVLIALAGWQLRDASIGLLFVVPIAISAVVLNWMQLIACAVVAAILTEEFRPHAVDHVVAEFALAWIAFSGIGLLVAERVQSRRNQARNLAELRQECELRKKADDEAHALLESSPAATITIDPYGRIQMINSAAKRLLRLESTDGAGHAIGTYFPVLGDLMNSRRTIRLTATMVEGFAKRSNGDVFFAQMWLSSYHVGAGMQITAVIADGTEYLRDREELGLRQLLMSSRVIAAAVSHEIRNIAAAADTLHSNIRSSFGVAGNADFEALGQLIQAMRKLSSAEVHEKADQILTGVDVHSLLRELSIIAEAEGEDAGVRLIWEAAENLQRVRADHSGLLQVLLNLTQNSIRALKGRHDGAISVSAFELGESVFVRFSDNGPGIAAPEMLFQPFQTGATATGLGLYVSRAIIRTFGGELQYLQREREGYFLIELLKAHMEVLGNA